MNSIQNMDCSVLVCSCDTYEDTWYPFFELFSKYWPVCPFAVVLNTETKKYRFKEEYIDSLQMHNKNDSYSKRLLDYLKYINTDYVLIMLDDFFIRSEVDNKRIMELLEYMRENDDVAVISFDSVEDELNVDDGNLEGFLLRPRYGDYLFNLQSGIWNRKKLMSLLNENENPWELEIYGSMRCSQKKYRFYTLKDLSLTPINYGKRPGLTWGIVRGKWVYDDVEDLFKDNNISIDLSIRGNYYNDKKKTVLLNNSKISLRDRIERYGFGLFVKMQVFRVVRIIRKTLHLEYENDYFEYKRKTLRGELRGE